MRRWHRSGIAVLLLLLGACGAAKEAGRSRDAAAPMEQAYRSNGAVVAKANPSTRLLVRTASIEVAVASVSKAADEAVVIAVESGGYVHESSIEKDGRAKFELRVPAAQLDAVLAQLGDLGEETNRQVSTEDVTDEVADLDAELANKRALRDRLRDLLKRAQDVKDVLAVEAELTRVQTDIDSLEARLVRLRTDVAYSAIQLTLTPPPPPKESRILGPLGYLYVGTKWVVTKLFVIREGTDED